MTSNAGENVEQQKFSFTSGGNTKWYSHFGRLSDSFFFSFLFMVVQVRWSPFSPHPSHPHLPPLIPALLVQSMCPSQMFLKTLPSFPPIIPSQLPTGYCQIVLNFNVSGYISFLVCFVDQVPMISDIIWYLSFTTWLISLSIMLSRSIHAAVKGMSSFFLSVVEYSIV